MEDYPRTLLEFEKKFKTEEECRQYLHKIRWPGGFRCPRCGHPKVWITKRGLYRCASCDFMVSVIAGTIFQGSRLPLCLWFRAIWHIVSQKNGVSGLGLQKVLGLKRYETTWILLHKLRTAMVRPGRERLHGTVEADETYMGGERPGKRGRGATNKTMVLIAVEDKGNEIGRIRLQRIDDASANSLIPAIQKNVELGSIVRTDGWNGYNGLITAGYKHLVVRQSADVGENMLPLVNRVASLLKRWLQGTHQGAVQKSHLDYYLDEFTFRFNRRTSRSRGKLFYRLIQQAVAVEPVTGNYIRGGQC
ncbi:MAG: IS1595 family transposase [Nitrospirota bacterium]